MAPQERGADCRYCECEPECDVAFPAVPTVRDAARPAQNKGRFFVLTQRRPAALAACIFALTGFVVTPAGADPVSVSISVDSEASQAAPSNAVAPNAAAAPSLPVRRFHRKPTRHASVRALALPSRGADGAAGVSVVGRLAVVVNDSAPIHAGRERYGRVLSLAPKGQSLALSGETATEFAVLMVDRSVGYIAKSDVQLLNYQVVTDTGTLGQRLVQTAQGFLGVPYVWGGNTRDGIDCSGFVKAVYAANGMELPRFSGDQAGIGYDVPHNVANGDWTAWVPGDRLYFACHHPRIDHTGMYIGNGLFIHASVGHDNQVAIDRVDNAYYSAHLMAVRRSPELLSEPPMPGDGAQPAFASSAASAADPEASQQ